ncbi:MAG: acetoacetyl-CoA reductase [Limnobacter sp.]|nr:acetoacetyl-CoA reductase [Limnobacter sp.]
MNQRIALVTGGMGGLGTAICQRLYEDGYKVLVNCLPAYPEKAAWLEKQRGLGYEFHAAEGDVSDYESCTRMIASIEAEFGQVDVLINNAGITRDKFFPKLSKENWDAVMGTNLDSLFNVTHQVSSKMTERGWGRIVNISSVNALRGQAGQTNYTAAKAGCIGFTKALAQEVAARGVTVNAIAPGFIETEMVLAIREDIRQSILDIIPMKRPGTPQDIGAAVSFLCSDQASYITGTTLNVNGGVHMQ